MHNHAGTKRAFSVSFLSISARISQKKALFSIRILEILLADSEKSRIFAVINPTTLLVRKASVPGWDFVFYEDKRMRYTKQAISLAEQIKTLHERGLIIEDCC